MKLSKENNKNFCGTKDTATFSDCDWLRYIESIALQGFLPILLGLIAFPIAFIVVWSARVCCCKARKPSKGIFCGDTEKWEVEKDGYTNSESTMIVMILVVASVVFLAFMSYAIVADDEMSGHISDFVGTLKNTSVGLSKSLDTIQTTVEEFGKGSTALFSMGDVETVTENVQTYLWDFSDFADNAKNVVDQVNTYRRMFLYISFIGPAALCVVAVIGGLLSIPLLSYP